MTKPDIAAMRVRHARVDDRDLLLELWERSVRATHHFLTESDIVGLRPLVAQELASDAIGWWVLASDDDVPVGFLGFANDAIEALFLDPDARGKGGGRILVAHAERLATSPLSVDVNEDNQEAQRFYEALGFSVVGRSPLDSGGRPFAIIHMKRQTQKYR